MSTFKKLALKHANITPNQEHLTQTQAAMIILFLLEASGDNTYQEWNVKFVDNKRYLGRTIYGKKTIKINNQMLTSDTVEKAYGTCAHEVAHVRAGSQAKHGKLWKQWATLLGAPARAMSASAVNEIGRAVLKAKTEGFKYGNGNIGNRVRITFPKRVLEGVIVKSLRVNIRIHNSEDNLLYDVRKEVVWSDATEVLEAA